MTKKFPSFLASFNWLYVGLKSESCQYYITSPHLLLRCWSVFARNCAAHLDEQSIFKWQPPRGRGEQLL